MLKRKDSAYLVGRKKGFGINGERDPPVIDAALMYAQRGHGKRSGFFSDFAFGVWRPKLDGEKELVPVGKAYFKFTDQELEQIDKFARKYN